MKESGSPGQSGKAREKQNWRRQGQREARWHASNTMWKRKRRRGKTAGTGKGERGEKVSAILKLESSAGKPGTEGKRAPGSPAAFSWLPDFVLGKPSCPANLAP